MCLREREETETQKYRDRDKRERENERILGVPLKISRALFHAGWMGYSTQTIISQLGIQAAEETQ